MIFLIKIDHRTLKKNPNAGSTITYLPGTKSVKFIHKGKELPNYLIDGQNCWVFEEDYQNHIIKGEMIGQINSKIINKITKDKNTEITFHQEVQKIAHLPEPDYFYQFRKTKVECQTCRMKFDHHELQSDSFMDYYSDSICPECGEWDCCQLKYESL